MTISLVDKVAGTTPAGGGGAVSSVNSRTGDVVLTAAAVQSKIEQAVKGGGILSQQHLKTVTTLFG